MNILLDTHAVPWWITDDAQLSAAARAAIRDSSNVLRWSAAIKYSLGRLPLPEEPETFLQRNRIMPLPMADRHAFQAGRLPWHHKDPFDRMLIAQAQTESLALLSCDSVFHLYDVRTLW